MKSGDQKKNFKEPRDQHWMARALKIFLPIFALLLVAAMIYDGRKAAREISSGRQAGKKESRIADDIERLQEGLNAARMNGPDNEFSMVPPANWKIDRDGSEGYFDLTFRGSEGLEISVLATPVDYSEYANLRRRIERKEMDVGLKMHIEEGEFNGHPALFRTCRLETQQLYTIDFLANGRAHHLLFAAPYELYDRYLPIAKSIMRTYEAGPPSSTPNDEED